MFELSGEYIAGQRDITERKRTEEALRASEQNYRQLYLSVRDGIASVDLDGGFHSVFWIRDCT